MRYQDYFVEGLLLGVFAALLPVRVAQDVVACAGRVRRRARRLLR